MFSNMYVQLLFLLKAVLAPEVWPRSITRRSKANNPNAILHGGLQFIEGLPLNFSNTIPGAPVKGDKEHLTKGVVLPDPVAFFRAGGLGFKSTCDVLTKSRHHAWQMTVALTSASDISDTSVPDLLVLAPHKIVGRIMQHKFMVPNAMLNLCEEMSPSMVPIKSMKHDVLKLGMESSKDNPKSFFSSGFPPNVMERKDTGRTTSKFPYVFMARDASSITWHEPF